MEHDYSKLIGISYEEADCWDIAKEFYSQIFGVELKHYYSGDRPNREETQKLVYSGMTEFEEVKNDRQFGDLILLKFRGIESHIAVYLGKGKFLHSSKSTGSVVESLEKWKHLVVGFYRLKGFQK